MRLLRTLLVVAALLLAGWAQADERILKYDVTIEVQKNADLIVTENITVNSEGRKIRRGIFRDLPRYKIDEGDTIPYLYKILSVTKNGEREPFDKSSDGNAKRVRIGDADVYLNPGVYAYEIVYRVRNEIRYGESADELYWNVTGNYWDFPIDEARVQISFPAGVSRDDIQEINGFVGNFGSAKERINVPSRFNPIVIEVAESMAARQGLTISVLFDKGLIDSPSTIDKGFLWWFKNGALFLLSFSLVGLFGYYYSSWSKVGRDPEKLPVYPRYNPPEGLSAAATHRLLNRMGPGNEAITSTLMSLAVKGAIQIDSTKKATRFEKLGLSDLSAPLLADEKLLYEKLFKGSSKTLTLKGKTHKAFSKAHIDFNKHLSDSYGETYFKWNAAYTITGIVLSALAIGAAVSQVYGAWKPGFALILGALVLLNLVFLFLMPAPTRKGEAIVSEIEGFKLYLKTAESNRFAKMISGNPADAPPTMTQELYERFLPYAVALDVEKPWSKYFEKMLPDLADKYDPSWGHIHNSRGGASGFSKSLSSNISSGVSSAAPQSSGSSGGGGFSGGGGGGGGGGGW